LQVETKSAKVYVRDGFIVCPVCQAKLRRLLPTTSGRDLVEYCHKCKIEFIVNIEASPSLTASAAAVESIET